MTCSLSILLPVHNAQATLETRVRLLLDWLPELTRQFEILLIDDGSTDATAEIAHELSTYYPQVHSLRHMVRRGMDQAVALGMLRAMGEVIIAHDGHSDWDNRQIAQLWRTRHEPAAALAVAHRRTQHKRTWMTRIMRQQVANAQSSPQGFRLIRRSTATDLQRSVHKVAHLQWHIPATDSSVWPSQPQRPNFLSKVKQFTLDE